MKSKDLEHLTIVELRRLAKDVRVSPKRTMTKSQLIKAIVRATKSKAISQTLKQKRSATKKTRITSKQSAQTKATSMQRKQTHEETLPVYKTINKLVLMPRDPWWVFAYWEVDRGNVPEDKLILKLYRQGDRLYASINVGNANNWYINLPEPSDTVRAELGYIKPDAGFVVIAVSNIIKTPRAWPSDVGYTGAMETPMDKYDNPFMDAYASYERANPYIRETITSRKR
ncbi:MAG: DUF4912 domain-containing protein [bacterium]